MEAHLFKVEKEIRIFKVNSGSDYLNWLLDSAMKRKRLKDISILKEKLFHKNNKKEMEVIL